MDEELIDRTKLLEFVVNKHIGYGITVEEIIAEIRRSPEVGMEEYCNDCNMCDDCHIIDDRDDIATEYTILKEKIKDIIAVAEGNKRS